MKKNELQRLAGSNLKHLMIEKILKISNSMMSAVTLSTITFFLLISVILLFLEHTRFPSFQVLGLGQVSPSFKWISLNLLLQWKSWEFFFFFQILYHLCTSWSFFYIFMHRTYYMYSFFCVVKAEELVT